MMHIYLLNPLYDMNPFVLSQADVRGASIAEGDTLGISIRKLALGFVNLKRPIILPPRIWYRITLTACNASRVLEPR